MTIHICQRASIGDNATFREQCEVIIALSGSFDVMLDDGTDKKTVRLERAYYGLYVPRQIWRELINFSSGAICLVLASQEYNEGDYIRDYAEFVRLKTKNSNVKM